jgi:hypothetical protein
MRMGRCRGRLGGGITTLLIPAVWEFFRGVVRTGISCIYRNRFILVKAASGSDRFQLVYLVSSHSAYPRPRGNGLRPPVVCSPDSWNTSDNTPGQLRCIGIPKPQPAPALLNKNNNKAYPWISPFVDHFHQANSNGLDSALSCTNRQIPTAFRRWWSAQAVKFEVRRAKLPDTAGVQRAKPLRD